MNVYDVGASYLYKEGGQTYERTLHQQYLAENGNDAILAAIRWGIERGKSPVFGSPVCIKVHPFNIFAPEPSGCIKSGIGWPIFEWKYDTSPWTIEQLLSVHQKKEG